MEIDTAKTVGKGLETVARTEIDALKHISAAKRQSVPSGNRQPRTRLRGKGIKTSERIGFEDACGKIVGETGSEIARKPGGELFGSHRPARKRLFFEVVTTKSFR